MPSIDPKDLEALRPYLDLCQRLGSFARQASGGSVSSIHITYWGGIVDFDAVPLTRAVLKGWLAGIAGDEGINGVNAPHKIKALGIKVETIKSSDPADYSELIEVKTFQAKAKSKASRALFSERATIRVSSRLTVRPLKSVPWTCFSWYRAWTNPESSAN